jgi:hypothetical protein
MPSNGHGPHQHINGSLPPLKNGLGSLADDMYLNRLHTKIGHEMDVDLPKVQLDFAFISKLHTNTEEQICDILGEEILTVLVEVFMLN